MPRIPKWNFSNVYFWNYLNWWQQVRYKLPEDANLLQNNLWLSQKDFLKIPEIGIQVPNQATPAPPGILAQYLPILAFSKSGKAYQNREEKSGKKIEDCKTVDLNIAVFKIFIEVLCYFMFYENWFS